MARKSEGSPTAGYIVHLEQNMADADAQATLQAIARIKGVSGVEAVTADTRLMLAQRRERQGLRTALLAVLKSLG